MSRAKLVTHSQNREDIILSGFFKNVNRGFYADIGANHPTEDSVTRLFYDAGWRGINVEPNTRLFKSLEKNRPRDINVNVGISDKPGELEIREYEGWYAGLSTFSKEMQAQNDPSIKFRDVKVKTITLKQLFEENKVKDINFMKVDVEGYEYNVLKSNDWVKYRPQILCIEANHNFKDWSTILSENRYIKVFFDGLNEYYVAEEHKNLAERFSYVDSVIGPVVIDAETNDNIHSLEHRNEQLTSELNSYKSENLQLKRDIIELKKVIPLLKQLFKSLDGSFRRRIEKLNERKKKKQPDEVNFDDTPMDKVSATSLLKKIQLYDMSNFYSNNYEKDRITYRVVSSTYNFISNSMFSLGKALLGLIRKVKR